MIDNKKPTSCELIGCGQNGQKGTYMNDSITLFKNPQFGEIRTITQDGDPWFIAKDVAEILGYERPDNAIRTHIDDSDRLMHQISASGQNRSMIIINESGLYALIMSSKLPIAKSFRRWVTAEVLPSIRRDGGYIQSHAGESDEVIMARALLIATEAIKRKDNQIADMQPKAIFADAVSVSHTSVLVGDLAKMINQNGIDIGANRLFAWLRENGYLIRRNGTDYNMPTQVSMDLGLFSIKETVISHSDGHTSISKTPKVTGKGQLYFINKFLDGGKAS